MIEEFFWHYDNDIIIVHQLFKQMLFKLKFRWWVVLSFDYFS